MVSHRGIEENPTKVDAIRRTNRPTRKKDVMKLTRMMAALGRFISKLGEKGLPFFKILKKVQQVPVDRRGGPGARGAEDLPHVTPSHGTPDAQGDLAALHLRVHPGGQCGVGSRAT
jgi:hypothetical protein